MSFLLPLLPSLLSAGAGLYGSYRENKLANRAQKRSGALGQFGVGQGEEKRFDRFTPQQQQLHQMIQSLLTGQGQQPQGGLLGDYGSEESFNQNVANPAIRNYEERIAPKIAERYAGLGAQSSSGFQNALASSGADLARQLGEFRGRQRQESTQNLLSQTLQPQFHTRYEQKMPTGAFQGLAGSGFENITKILTELLQQYASRNRNPGGL